MIRNPFARTRRPRPTDPEPYTRLDHLDGLPGRTRYDVEWPSVLAAEVGTVVGVSADEWSSLPPVFAPHSFVGGDLAAMAAPLPGMARDDLGTYAEPVEPHGRHRQTDPLDLILADLRDIEDRLS